MKKSSNSWQRKKIKQEILKKNTKINSKSWLINTKKEDSQRSRKRNNKERLKLISLRTGTKKFLKRNHSI